MIQALIDTSKFNGKFIAIKSYRDHTVIAEGKNPQETYEAAVQKGIADPVVTFIPASGMVQIY